MIRQLVEREGLTPDIAFQNERHVGSMVDRIYEYTNILVYLYDGTMLEGWTPGFYYFSTYAHDPDRSVDGETLKEFVERMGHKFEEVSRIEYNYDGHSWVEGHDNDKSGFCQRVVVYKKMTFPK